MEEKISGIVINSINYGEKDKILTIFSLEKGTICAKIKGVLKAGAKLKFACEPFCFCEYVIVSKAKHNTVISAFLIDSFYPIRENLYKLYSAYSSIEFVRKFYKEGISDKEMFVLLTNLLKDLAYKNQDVLSNYVRFLLKSLEKVGYALCLDGCKKCGCEDMERTFFEAEEGSFYCQNCAGGIGIEMDSNTYFYLQGIDRGQNYKDELLKKPIKLLRYYLEIITGEKFKALDSLIEMLNLM